MATTIDALAELMDKEAATWSREDSTQDTVNGAGIKRQWERRDKFPCDVYYLQYETVNVPDDLILVHTAEDGTRTETEMPAKGGRRAIFNLRVMWFDEDGNETERPPREE